MRRGAERRLRQNRILAIRLATGDRDPHIAAMLSIGLRIRPTSFIVHPSWFKATPRRRGHG